MFDVVAVYCCRVFLTAGQIKDWKHNVKSGRRGIILSATILFLYADSTHCSIFFLLGRLLAQWNDEKSHEHV